MENSVAITRVTLRNYKSIGYCDVKLGPLSYLVGENGSGKSNFLDALHFVKDGLAGSLDNALNERGGLHDVRRRSSGHPTHFSIRLEFSFKDGTPGYYAFTVGAVKGGGHEVQQEECCIGGKASEPFLQSQHGQVMTASQTGFPGITKPFFQIKHGQVIASSETSFPAITKDRLALVAVSGLASFRPLFDALTAMGFYNLNPKVIRELQKPQDGRLLKPVGENIASVIGHLERVAPEQLQIITEYLHAVVPIVTGVQRIPLGPVETIEFFQQMVGAKHPWRFLAQNMSDGTLRALGILVALFQGNRDYAPTLIGIEEPETALHPSASTALREALARASRGTQIIVTSHSPDLLNDPGISADSLLVVVSQEGETKIAPVDRASREAIGERLFSAGELLRLNQLAPDPEALAKQVNRQGVLFGEALE